MHIFNSIFKREHVFVIICASFLMTGCGQSSKSSEPKSEWIDPSKLTPGPIRHESLTDEQLARVTRVQKVFHEVDSSPLEKWVDDFRRDVNPDNEIKIYENMATAYEAFTASKTLSIDAKKDAYQVVLLRSAASEKDVLAHLKLKVLTEQDAREIMSHFSGPPEPIQVTKP
jgi:hypothetical protein